MDLERPERKQSPVLAAVVPRRSLFCGGGGSIAGVLELVAAGTDWNGARVLEILDRDEPGRKGAGRMGLKHPAHACIG